MPTKGDKCGCPHHFTTPILLVLFALTFLLGNLDVISSHTVGIIWPIIVGLAGVMKIGSSKCHCCKEHR